MDMGEILKELVKNVDGAMGSLLAGFDGVAVASVTADENLDMQEIAALVTEALTKVIKTGEDLKSGELEEFMAQYEKGILYARPVNDNYWIGLALESGANIGRAKMELKKALPKMLKEVS